MAAPIRVRSDLSSDQVRAFSRSCRDAGQVRRLLAIATILDGGSRSEAARIAGVTLQIIRDWVLRFNEAGIAGLATRKAPGPATILDDRHRRALEEVIATGPIPAVHGVVRWRIIDLAQWLGAVALNADDSAGGSDRGLGIRDGERSRLRFPQHD